jgi:hypothetical protein
MKWIIETDENGIHFNDSETGLTHLSIVGGTLEAIALISAAPELLSAVKASKELLETLEEAPDHWAEEIASEIEDAIIMAENVKRWEEKE